MLCPCGPADTKRKTKSVGKPALGGPFKLHTIDGKEFTEQDLVGKWSLMYFGFTFCPDICPEELDKMTEALTILGKLAGKPRGLTRT